MLRIERVEQYVRERAAQDQAAGITTTEVAQALGIWRSDASTFLNQLEKAGILTRSKSRPVRFFLSQTALEGEARSESGDGEKEIFPNIIGSSGSLRLQSQLARSAALYPPSGLHTLIIGETGVGKSLMAEEIWRCILRQRGLQESQCPFVVFNCAEYAENPQLLLSQLFGYEKGAFTGADQTRDGLIERARGGVLFLDEMHRLPATGQEMFFTVIDKGIYRRLGGTQERPIQLMIIGATTEDPEGSFLMTFRRRFPMLIQLPKLSDRPFRERMQMVELFLTQESHRLKLPVRVGRDVLKHMATYQGEGNIGELKNLLQICCAKAYSHYLVQEQDRAPGGIPSPVEITAEDIPRQMLTCLQGGDDMEQYFSSVLQGDSLTVYPEVPPSGASARECPPSPAFSSPPEGGVVPSGHVGESGSLWGTISSPVWLLAQKILLQAHMELGRDYPQGTCVSVALFLQQIQLYAKADSVYHAEFQIPVHLSEEEERFLRGVSVQISEALGIQMMEHEVQALSLLLRRSSQRAVPRIRLVIICHGDAIAAGIARFVNQILNTDLVLGIDIPIEDVSHRMVKRLCQELRASPPAEGTLLLSETMALSSYQEEISQAAGGMLRVIPFVNNILALELCKGILTTTQDMDSLIETSLEEFRQYAAHMLHSRGAEGGSLVPGKKSVIITLCMTGTGSAQMARDYLLSIPSIAEYAEVYSFSMTDALPQAIRQFGSRLRLIVGFVDPQIPGIPFLGVENLFTQSGLNRITILLHQWPGEEDRLIPFDFKSLSLENQLNVVGREIGRFAPSFDDPSVVSAEVRRVVGIICAEHEDISADRVVRLYIHTASMFERFQAAKKGGFPPDELPEQEHAILREHEEYFLHLRALISDSCARLGLPSSDAEVYYLMRSLPSFDHDT